MANFEHVNNEIQTEFALPKKNIFKKIPFPYWVFITLAAGFLLGTYMPTNPLVKGLAVSGTYFPKTIVTFATAIIFFLLAGATSKLILMHKDSAGKLFGRIFVSYLVLGLASLVWACAFIITFTGIPINKAGTETAGFVTYILSVLDTFKTIVSQQPLLQILVAAVLIGWIATTNKSFQHVAKAIMTVSDYVLKFFKWFLWYYPIMIGCLAINIPMKFGTKGIAYYGKTVLWVLILSISWSVVMLIATKLIAKRSWKLELEPLIHGAGHEFGLRAGTENTLLAVGLGKACEIAGYHVESRDLKELTDYFWRKLREEFEERIQLNGHPEERLPNTLNVSFVNRIGQDLLSAIPMLAASTGSACHAGSIELSPVLKEMAVPEEVGMGAIRFSLGRYTTKDEIDQVLEWIKGTIW